MSDLDLVDRARGFVNNDKWRSTTIDSVADSCVMLLLRMHWWSPIGRIVQVDIETAWNAALTGITVNGIIRGYDLDTRGVLSRLLIELDREQCRTASADELHWIVAEPCQRKRRASRLLLSSPFLTRIVDAPAFVDSDERRTIGIAVCTPQRMKLFAKT